MDNIPQILNQHNFKYKKSLGQNFITDKNLLRYIADISGAQNNIVIEIGAGSGTLTRELAAVAKKVYAFEIDTRLKPILEQTLQGINNIELIFADILKQNVRDIERNIGGEYVVAANLPYYITTPVILHFLENAGMLKSMTLMVQKEVANRLLADAGSAQYGSITVAVNFYGNVKFVKNVSKELFYPRPNVDSAIIKIDIVRDKIRVSSKKLFIKLYRAAFAMRRKTLANNIAAAFNINKDEAQNIIEQCGFDRDIRGEKLSAEQFARIADVLGENIRI